MPESQPESSANRRTAALVFGIGLAISLAMVLFGWRAQHFVVSREDPYAYEAMGLSVLHGRGFAGFGSVLNRRGPLYPLVIALLYRVFGPNPLVVQLAQVVMMGLICLLAYDTARRLFNTRTGVIAGILCAVHPGLLRYVPDFHVEILLTLLFTLTVWFSVRYLNRPSWQTGAGFGAACALAALTKAVVLLYPPLFVLWMLWLRRRSDVKPRIALRPLLISVAAIFVAMGIIILPWTYRNYRSSGRLELVTTGLGDAFLRGYIFSKPDYALLKLPPYTYAENESNAYFRTLCADQGTVWERNDIESDRILARAARAKLLASPAGFVRKFVVGLFTFWYQMTSRANSAVMGLLALVCGALALVGWRRARREKRALWPVALPILYLNVLLAALLALGRYSVPVLPCLVILAAYGIDAIGSRPR